MPDDEEYDPDERVSLYPKSAEDVLRKLLGAEEVPVDEEGPSESESL